MDWRWKARGRMSNRRRSSSMSWRGSSVHGRTTKRRSTRWRASAHMTTRRGSSHWRTSAHRRVARRRAPRTSTLSCLLRWPSLRLCFKLVKCLLGCVCHYRVLPVQLLLWHVVHHLPHASLATQADTTEPLALPIGSVLIELDLYEVGHRQVLHTVLDVLVCGPPGQVTNIQLPSSALPSRASHTSGWRRRRLHVILLLRS